MINADTRHQELMEAARRQVRHLRLTEEALARYAAEYTRLRPTPIEWDDAGYSNAELHDGSAR
jgi:hypothetical protein